MTAEPRWNLNALYRGLKSQELLSDQDEVNERVLALQSYEDEVARLSGADLGQAIGEYEEIQAIRHKISSYVTLLEAEDRKNFAKTEALKKWQADIDITLAFFTSEIGAMQEADLMTKLVAPELAQYAPWLARQRQKHQHVPEKSIAAAASLFEAVNADAWRRLYAETVAGLDAEDGSTQERQRAAVALKEAGARMALIYNTLIKDAQIEAHWEKYPRPDHPVHLENGFDPVLADTMFDTVKASFIPLSQKFYSWRVQNAGAEKMTLPELADMPFGGDVEYSWGQARTVVLRAFRKFSPKFARIAQKFFDEGHIDAQQREGKSGAPFMLSAETGGLPYILLNFEGDVDSVTSRLAHELGHGIHQVLVERAQGMFLADMPTHVAETASIFAEMLVFEELLNSEKDPQLRQGLLEENLSNMLNNALLQLSYYDFERRVHAARQKGELDAEQISDIWIETQKEFYGAAVELDDYDRYFWMTVPHFFDTPFYVYSYSFAQLAVGALLQEYKKAQEQGSFAQEAFADNYQELLETGLTKNMHEMFKPFGLDPEKPEFWKRGLSLIGQYLDEMMKPQNSPPAPNPVVPPPTPPTSPFTPPAP